MVMCDVKINNDGTILIPSELRKLLDLSSGDQVTVFMDKNEAELQPELLEALMHEGIILDFQD